MAPHRDPDFHMESSEVRRLKRSLDNAFVCEWKSRGEGRSLEYGNKFSLLEFFDLMMRMGDRGYVIGAAIFARRATELETERAVRSHVLTRLARMLHDMDGDPKRVVRESAIAHMGRFVDALIEDMAQMHVEWAEDMDARDPARDLTPQPTAVIRGVFLSPSLDQRKTVRFWELAAASERFPCRIFSDPCLADEGAMFSSYHQRAFALVFTYAPDAAVERFAAHMREHAVRKMVKRFDKTRDLWADAIEDVGTYERKNAFINIAGNIPDARRREKVTQLFGLEA